MCLLVPFNQHTAEFWRSLYKDIAAVYGGDEDMNKFYKICSCSCSFRNIKQRIKTDFKNNFSCSSKLKESHKK